MIKHIRVKGNTLNSANSIVEIDGVPCTNVAHLSVSFDANSLTEVTIRLLGVEVDIDTPAVIAAASPELAARLLRRESQLVAVPHKGSTRPESPLHVVPEQGKP